MRRLFGTDGIRGRVNESLSCELLLKVGMSLKEVFSKGIKKPKILIGIDTRNSSEMLAYALMSGLSSVGCDSDFLGVVPTPLVAYLVKKHSYNAGVMISASHNTFEHNGIKIFNQEGDKLEDELEEEIENLILSNNEFELCEVKDLGIINQKSELIEEYIDYVVSLAKWSKLSLKIGVDCANGSTSKTIKKIFKKLNIDACYINNHPNGFNINENSGATNLTSLKNLVLNNNLDIGFAFDGDGDRLMIVDGNGHTIDGDYILGVLGEYLKENDMLNNSVIVGTIMSNLGLARYLKERNISFIPTKVGDRYVLEEMKNGSFSLGGEQSGHIIIKDYLQTGDGQLTAIIFLNALIVMKKSINEIRSTWIKYPQKNININATTRQKKTFLSDERIKNLIQKSEEELGEDGRIIARASGTEDLVRVMVEAIDEEKASNTIIKLSQEFEKIMNDEHQK